MQTIDFQKLHPEAKLPTRATPRSIGLDIYAHLLTETGVARRQLVPARSTVAIPTGLRVRSEFPFFVCSRSGLAKERSIFVANAPGVMDEDYRGQLFVLLYNGGFERFDVWHHQKIAQLVMLSAVHFDPIEVTDISDDTERGSKGFGSTGDV